jgi:cytochrome c peroxidase
MRCHIGHASACPAGRIAVQYRSIALLIPLSLLAATGCAPKTVVVDAARLKMFAPLPAAAESVRNPVTEAKVDLGRMLYYEPRLSRNQDVSCNSCHDLAKYGVDGVPVSDGHKHQKGTRNAPTVYNAAGHFVQFWDGRAADVEEQAKGPVLNPVEMAMSSDRAVVAVLKSIPEYVDAFRKAFPAEKDPVTFGNAATAIGAFERRLMTPSRWDRFLKGDQAALSEVEKAGLKKFMDTGCQGCHAGAYVGGAVYQKLGAAEPYPDSSDNGRQAVTKQESDRMVFKVPSLRNISKTAPYFHNGKVATLEQAVKGMAEYQLGQQLASEDVGSIVAFLKTLTGEIPAEYIRPPALPKSTAKTPKPSNT